jgi:hypothetical protein
LVPPSAPPSITDIASQAVPEDSADNLGTNFQKTPPESSELRQDPEFLEEPEEELLVLVDRVSEFETFNDINRPQDQPQTIVSEALQNEPRSQGDVQAEAQADTQAEASSLKAVTPEDLPPRSTPLPNEEVNAAEVSPAEGEVVTFALFFENGKGSESIKENISPKTQDLVSQPDHLTTTPLESLAPAESPDKLGSKVLSGESEKEGEESSLPYLGENIQPQEEIEPYSNYQSAESLEAETLSQPLKGLQAVTQREISLEEELAVDLLEDEEEILVDLTEQDPLRELMLGENPPEDIAPDNLPIEELILVEPVRGPLEEEIFGERSPLVASASASAPSEESEDYQQTTSQRAPKAPIIPFPAAPPALEEQLAKNSDPQFRDNCLGRETVFLPANFLPVEYLLATLDSRDSDGD